MEAPAVVTPPLPATAPAASDATVDRRSAVPARVPALAMGAAAATVALLTCAAALLVAGGAPPTGLPDGLADPGPTVGWGLRLIRPLALVAAVVTVGSLMVAAGLGPPDRELLQRCLRLTRRTAALWSAAGVTGFVLTVCDALGVPVSAVSPSQLLPWSTDTAAVSHLALALGAAAVAMGTFATRTSSGARVLLVVALGASLTVPAAGHVAGLDDGGSSLSGLLVHVVAALVWTGGLAGLVLHLRNDRAALAIAVPRFSALALAAYLALATSGLIAVAGMLPFSGPEWVAAWSSGYAGVVAGKVALLVLLGAVGLRHRQRTLPRVLAGEPRSFLRLAAGELLLMAVAAGLATALARTPVPAQATPDHRGQSDVEELSVVTLATAWQPNAVVLVVVAVAVAAYVVAARASYDGEGRPWPRRRTVCFVSGAVLAVLTLCSSVATYAPVLLSVHVVQLLLMLLVVPALLLLGRPALLVRASRRLFSSRFGRDLLSAPATGAVATFVLLTVLYRTPLVELTLRSPWWHLLVLTVAAACGAALLRPLLAADERGAGRRGERAGWLATVAATFGILALQLGTGDKLLAAAWFSELRLGWAEPVSDQRLAGGVFALAAVALAVLAAVVVARTAPKPQSSRSRVVSPPSRGQSVTSTRPSRSSAPNGP